ncbi:hypothetical protein BJ742DRAFT_135772 [Cladochytrium replicatum]|nr:hypothetical protein BJ742DRAFT_135772 [Cladochytrium replicatum]
MSPEVLKFTLLIVVCARNSLQGDRGYWRRCGPETDTGRTRSVSHSQKESVRALQLHVLTPLTLISAGTGTTPDTPTFAEKQHLDLWTRIMSATAELDIAPLPIFLRVPTELRTGYMVNYSLRAVGKRVVSTASEADAALRVFVLDWGVLGVLKCA